MTSTAHTSSPSSSAHATQKPASAQNAGGAQAPGQSTRKGAPVDLFANLLALVADASAIDATPLNGAAAGDKAGDGSAAATADAPGDNPLAALMSWPALDVHGQASAAGQATAGANAGPSGTATTAREASSAPAGPALAAERAAAGPDRRSETAHPDTLADAAAQEPRRPAVAASQAHRALAAAGAGQPGSAAGSEPVLRWQRQPGADSFAAPAQTTTSVRSTVALDERFQARVAAGVAPTQAGVLATTAEAGAVSALDPGLPGASASGALRAGSDVSAGAMPGAPTEGGVGDGSSGAEHSAEHGSDGGRDDAANPFADAAMQAEDEALDVQHWGTGALRQASLRVGADGDQAIDIQLSLRGDEVQVDLRSNDAATRELLREQANAALGERLQQGGLQLGGVSVGAQGQGQGNEGRGAPGRHRPDPTAGDSGPAPTARHNATAHKGTLDLYV